MSAEPFDARNLPVVDPVPVPGKLSQTLLRHANGCKRSAYLYVTRGGGVPAVQLDFGSAFHAFAEGAMRELIAAEEKRLYAPAEGEDVDSAARAVASLTAAMVDDLLRERRDLQVPVAHPTHSVDHLREQAYHWAVACDIDPEQVLALEQMIELELPSGLVVRGKLDVVTDLGIATDGLAGVDDWKTTFNAETEGEFEDAFQCKLYATLLLFGTPVERVRCPECEQRAPDSDAQCTTCPAGTTAPRSSWFHFWRSLPKLGDGVNWVRGRELYPRLAPRDGALREVRTMWSRQALADWLPDLDLLATDLVERLESGDVPAVPGSWCSECPSPAECPIPAVLRRHAGAINTAEEAAEAAAWADRMDAAVKATRKELRAKAKQSGPIRYGDKVLEFTEVESRVVESWPALEVAVAEAVSFGVPFDWSDFRKPRVSARFGARKLAPAELGSGDIQTEVQSDGSRFGDDPPF